MLLKQTLFAQAVRTRPDPPALQAFLYHAVAEAEEGALNTASCDEGLAQCPGRTGSTEFLLTSLMFLF